MPTMYASGFEQDIYMGWVLLLFENLISTHVDVLQLEILKAKTKVLRSMQVTVTDVTV